MENITLEEALDLFKLPRTVGKYEDADVTIAIGRFGPYAKHNSAFYSLQKTDDPYEVTLERAIEIIEAKRKAERERVIKIFDHKDEKVQVLNGRWGPYLTIGDNNYKLPKDKEPTSLTLADCLHIADNTTPSQKGFKRGRFAKKAVAEKPEAKPLKAAASKKPAPKKKKVVKKS